MIDGKRVIAVIAARGGSKGLPRKNVRMVGGRPLVAWPVLAARGSRIVDRVIVSTDDPEIADAARRKLVASCHFIRPAESSSDTASSMSVVRHALDVLAAGGDDYDYVALVGTHVSAH